MILRYNMNDAALERKERNSSAGSTLALILGINHQNIRLQSTLGHHSSKLSAYTDADAIGRDKKGKLIAETTSV